MTLGRVQKLNKIENPQSKLNIIKMNIQTLGKERIKMTTLAMEASRYSMSHFNI